MPTPPKAKKPTIKSLLAELEAGRATIENLTAQIAERDEELAVHRKAQSGKEAAQSKAESDLSRALAALAAFKTKTKDWTWPPDEIEVIRPLTWGDLKRAATTATELS